MFLIRGQDNIVRTIEERIARYTMIPVENGEGFQVKISHVSIFKIAMPVLKVELKRSMALATSIKNWSRRRQY